MLATIIGNYCNILSQVNSEFSPIMPEEFEEHLIRDQRPFSSSRISPDPSDSQLHVSTSSLQFTHSFSVGFRSEDWDRHGKRFILCLFWCLSWIVVLVEDPNTAQISNRGSQILMFYLLIFDRIHDAMHLNKIFRTSDRKTSPQH